MIEEIKNRSDEFVSDEKFALKMDIPEPTPSPSLEKCGICTYKTYNADPNERIIKLKGKRALDNCNYMAKRRKMKIKFQVIIQNS